MILGIDTSTPRASLALWDPAAAGVAWRAEFTTDRAHNAAIFGPFTEMLEEFRDAVTGVAVGLGPGSYGGIRVGIAVANGLALVRDLPVVGLSSLEAFDVTPDDYAVVGDARRRSGYVARVTGRRLQGEPELIDDDRLAGRVDALAGEGLALFSADASVAGRFDAVEPAFPAAALVAERAAGLAEEEWEARTPLEPRYLRAPHITTPRRRG